METKNRTYQKGLTLPETLHGGQSGEQLVQELGDVLRIAKQVFKNHQI